MKRLLPVIALALCLAVLCSGCFGVSKESKAYFKEVKETLETVEEAAKGLNTALANADPAKRETLETVTKAARQLKDSAAALAALSAPEEFSSVHQLYSEAAEEIALACDTYSQAYQILFGQTAETASSYEELQEKAAQHMSTASEKLTEGGAMHEELMNQ